MNDLSFNRVKLEEANLATRNYINFLESKIDAEVDELSLKINEGAADLLAGMDTNKVPIQQVKKFTIAYIDAWKAFLKEQEEAAENMRAYERDLANAEAQF